MGDARMPKTRHGGAREDYLERFGCLPQDFSANVNPLGMSPAARQAAIAAVDQAVFYPDPNSRRLVGAIAAHDGVPESCVVVGNGAADLICRLAAAMAPRRALVLAPTFSEYEDALCQAGCEVVRHELLLQEDLVPTDRLLDDVVPGIDVVFVCEPNNPTGLCMGRPLLVRLLERCRQVGARLVVDECFNGFLPDPKGSSVRSLAVSNPHLVILAAFTKLYGMAGLRLGYLMCSDAELTHRVAAVGQSWPVSCVAQAAGVAALADADFVERTRCVVGLERERLMSALECLGLEVWCGQANYLLLRSRVENLYELLAERGVLVRDCSNYHGLGPGFVRVAVRRHQENDLLIETIGDVLSDAADKGGEL
ncbi:threonine-phosphate decarboxylase [Paratractidigestivibacter sp.]|uniref:threonine-phosphate decarboxylase n=1 Tax=Paratractidigestivibacter sp. TaxID=2847316 RepID=UPI002AC8AA96|nr:threonine-phosphate decarboxylase [Paratractidigestivibacter sp.]